MKRLSASIIQFSDMEKEVEIYVRMVDGTEVFVPVKAIQIGANSYQIIDEEQSYDPILEPWDFKPGDIVSCSYREFKSDRGHPFRRICNPTAMRRGFVIPS